MLKVANSCAWSRCFDRAKLRWKSNGSPGPSPRAPQRERLLPSVRQSRGGDWMLKAKLPAHARFWNAGGTFADRPAKLSCG